MRKLLFIDRDGVLINEPADDPQIDDFSKLSFVPGLFTELSKIVKTCNYTLVMVTNQDGLGTFSFPADTFWPIQNFIVNTLDGEGIVFEDIHIDPSVPEDNSNRRKPGTGMLTKYLRGEYDLANSFVIGDRLSDMQLAANLGCQGIRINYRDLTPEALKLTVAFEAGSWGDISSFLLAIDRKSRLIRNTKETKINVGVNLDGSGEADINTGLPFFDHMLDQIARHASVDLSVQVAGDLEVDEHHTIEDTALALGEVFATALGKKAGIGRYGFALPMDEVNAQALLDFGGRPHLRWEVDFSREALGNIPVEMFEHFFKSFTDTCKCNLAISADGTNNHHIIESVFKAFARAIRAAARRDVNDLSIPSTKGII